jgi:hypothetical protein
MGGRCWSLLLVASAAVVAACGDQPRDVATAPEFASGSGSCNYTTVSSLTKAEFGNNSTQAGWAGDVKFYGAQSAGATYSGYKIFKSIAAKFVSQPGPSPSNAANLTLALLRCMNVGTTNFPDTLTLQSALGPNGAYGVRGLGGVAGLTPDPRSLFSHDTAWVIQPPASSNWQDVTTVTATGLADSLQDAMLIYGRQVSSGGFTQDSLVTDTEVFDWATLPGADFSPGIVVGECTASANYVQHNHDGVVEVLGHVTPNCAVTSGDLFSMEKSFPRSLASRLVDFFRPYPLSATTALVVSSGGSSKNLSPFGVVFPGKTVLVPGFKWNTKSNSNYFVNQPFSPLVNYQLTSLKGTKFLQQYVLVWLEATNNQGSTVAVCNNYAYTTPGGKVSFPNAYLNKAGGYTMTTRTAGAFTLTINGTPVFIPSVPPSAPQATSNINVKNSSTSAPSCKPPFTDYTVDVNGVAHLNDPNNPPDFPGPNGQ